MVYAYVCDVAASWEQYRRLAGALFDPPTSGLILHIAGPTDEGVRIIGVFASAESWEQHRAERLAPAIARLGGPGSREPTFRDLHPEHVVLRLPEEVTE